MSKTVCSCAKKSETNKKEILNSRTRRVELSQSTKSPVDHIRFLQRAIGNQAVERLFKSRVLHPKLKIGQPGDIYEQEADRVAEKVLNMPAPAGSMPSVQRVREEDEDIQKKPLAASITPAIQPKADDSFEVGNELESHLVANKGTGSPLPEEVRAYFEPRFGVDFSRVRTHSDLRAAETAQAINARAFTLGNDIVFGAGQYAPMTHEGRKLMAHELTHIVQQGTGIKRLSTALQITSHHDSAESQTAQEADVAITERAFLPSHRGYPVIFRQTPAPAGGTSSSPSPAAAPEIFVHNTELGGLSVGNFDFHFKNCSILVWVWVKFQFTKDINPAEQAAFKQRFINAVHNVWAHTGYSLSGSNGCPCGTIPIEIHVEENTKSFYHKLVDVERKTDMERRPKVISDININFDSSDNTIAHEFGHVLGLYDEYDGGFFENIMFWHKNQNDPNALMSDGTELRPRYFEHYRKQVQATAPKGCQYTISSPNPPVP